MPFGQLVIGPPGSGKTTYCNGISQYMRGIGRKVALVNLDPANDVLPYTPDIDIADLIDLANVMEELGLGPNGGLVYCMEYLDKNMDWLLEAMEPLEKEGCYFLFDLPGQVELFTQHASLQAIVKTLTDRAHMRLAAVHLVDAHLCTDAPKFISCLLLSLGTMLHLELPHVNVLSKVDLVRAYGKLDFSLDFYTEVQDLSYLVRAMGTSPFSTRFRKLSSALCEVVQDYGLVSFMPLAIQDQEAVAAVVGAVDKANGYVFASLATRTPYPPEFVYGAGYQPGQSDMWSSYQEKYIDSAPAVSDIAERANPAPDAPPVPKGSSNMGKLARAAAAGGSNSKSSGKTGSEAKGNDGDEGKHV
uniref:GPN-loop GTPase 2 n=1 Tax=Chlamydomonas leiostraca TaxID=1034604 RepID=A0A7S0RHC1_9CHLO|mmetsp:Transcript_22617/g.57535  ORF Transcript_22617/g.57535 Transcript_22617/m.57535 type:complete len:359 (+) Transcript_22617:264-1340(+)|eukprot:CAMPEP_0202867838 /NCGR_PEP_ID=MMETSP1391-20130828/9652_1 /ASSEMBLY_ACC=CAM_ASM_000867 /TAXON_ID=1034604 /ORGANISM="Chlamydomonas leiostraca, Strain SAG 11-49" /LENGTH=358 /DNA_ID=CAMNT_0049547915 /DNA_START=264 /DNA_END=1340 /DNA_ORIENTATION=-